MKDEWREMGEKGMGEGFRPCRVGEKKPEERLMERIEDKEKEGGGENRER